MKKHIFFSLSLSLLAITAFTLGFISPAYATSPTVPQPTTVNTDGCTATTPISPITGKPCTFPQGTSQPNSGQIMPFEPGCDSWEGVSKISGKPCKPTIPTVTTTTPTTTTTTPTSPTVINNYGCTTTTVISPVNGKPCIQIVPGYVINTNQNGSDVVAPRPANPQIAYWWGKVNQHIDSKGNWQTDKDGVSGANIDPLSYCRKFYPETKYITMGSPVKINDWRDRGNLSSYVGTSTPYNCVHEKNKNESDNQPIKFPPVKDNCVGPNCANGGDDNEPNVTSTTEPADNTTTQGNNTDNANNYIKDNGCNATTIYSLTTGEPCNPDVQPVIDNGKNNKQTAILKIKAVGKAFGSFLGRIF